MAELPFSRQYYQILNAATSVWQGLGFGFAPSVYLNALIIELRNRGFQVEQSKPFEIVYDDIIVGEYLADLVVDEEIIVSIHAGKALTEDDTARMGSALRAAGIRLGIMFNFGLERLETRRVSGPSRLPRGHYFL